MKALALALFVTSVIFGQSVSDPYRWLEDAQSAKTQAWLDQQNARAERVIDAYPENDRIAKRIEQLSLTGPQRYAPQLHGDTMFFMRETPPQPQPVLVAQQWPNGTPRVIADPATFGPSASIDWVWPSPSGKYIAIGTSAGGAETTTIRILELRGSRWLAETLGPAGGGTTGPAIAWDADERGFTYTRLPADGTQFNIKLYHHRLGTRQPSDALVQDAVSPVAEYQLLTSDDATRAAALVQFGDGTFNHVYLRNGSTWRAAIGAEAGIVAGSYAGKRLLLVATQGSLRGRIVALQADGTLKTIVAEPSNWAYHSIAPIRGGFLVLKSWGTVWRIDHFTEAGAFVRTVALPQSGIGIYDIASDSTKDDALITYAGWTGPVDRWVTYNATTGALRTVFDVTAPSSEYANVRVHEVTATSKDGTRVPVTVLSLAGTPQDGSAPAILTGYGGYDIPTTPHFIGAELAWLEMGGVLAEANIRGGSEFGEAWHQHGMLTDKQNVFDDFYASAQALVANKWTSTARLGIIGGSNGGLLVGAAMIQHPEEYRAVVGDAGIYDTLRHHLFPNGAYNVSEYGSVDDAAQFKALYAYSPYHHVVQGTKYPATLLITSENDPRVASWQSWKFAAALEHATGSTRPVIVLTHRSGGHGHGASFAQRVGNEAVSLSFLAQELGVTTDLSRWKHEAANVTIVRDDWGIAHVHGKTDADAVFGTIYAQAEDDFNRIESNYLDSIGLRAEAEGPGAIYRDLRMRLFVNPADLQTEYAASSPELRSLMDAWADGLNYYLAVHPAVHPRVIQRFEPWMALSFTEGSIGGDVERAPLDNLAAFYGGTHVADRNHDVEAYLRDAGSNGIAIAPSDTRDHHALLLINPHTSFFFRSELQMTSDQGLNAYGAVTWGQFFIYQGFNDHIGWMHTSTGVDAVDFFAETIVKRSDKLYYRYGKELRPVIVSRIAVPYRAADGSMASKTFTTYRTSHGPVIGERDGKWIAIALMQKPVEALSQSYYRTKAHDFASYRAIAANYQANSSNNTIFADDKGEIAFMTPQFIPRRDDRFDYTQAVDGSDPATDWHGIHTLDEDPHVVNPSNGWVFNTNDWPYSAAGPNSPKREDYPRYMDTVGEDQRGIHALRLLTGHTDFTLDSLVDAAFDSYQPAFASLVPQLLTAYDALPASDPLKAKLAEQVALLRGWDYRWGASSIETSVAVYWGEALVDDVRAEPHGNGPYFDRILQTTPQQKLTALATASDTLTADFGTWKTPWGEINRFQRLNDAIVQHFDDAAPSIPIPFTNGTWGSLAASYAVRTQTKRRYGTSGNSFVAVVEFGDKIRARAITAGGESGDPASPHFDDEAVRYSTGNLRDIYFYPDQLVGHTERTYHPGPN